MSINFRCCNKMGHCADQTFAEKTHHNAEVLLPLLPILDCCTAHSHTRSNNAAEDLPGAPPLDSEHRCSWYEAEQNKSGLMLDLVALNITVISCSVPLRRSTALAMPVVRNPQRVDRKYLQVEGISDFLYRGTTSFVSCFVLLVCLHHRKAKTKTQKPVSHCSLKGR